MKIKINEKETYNIEIPEEISSQEFLGLMSRLDIVSKIINKSSVFEGSNFEKYPVQIGNPDAEIVISKGSKNRLEFGKTREGVIKALKINYFGSEEDRNKFLREQGVANWKNMGKSISKYKKLWKIKNQEYRQGVKKVDYQMSKSYKKKQRSPRNNYSREDIVRLVKLQYLGSDEEKDVFMKSNHISNWTEFSRSIWYFRNKFKIKPQEIGVKKFQVVNK
jgi:hypothetical protein